MEAGRELDALVAEKVMGQKVERNPGGTYWAEYTGSDGLTLVRCCPKSYSTDISAAWEVVEKLRADHIEPLIEWDEEDQEWYVHLNRYNTETECSEPICNAHAPDAPHAICLAALKAVGYSLEEEKS